MAINCGHRRSTTGNLAGAQQDRDRAYSTRKGTCMPVTKRSPENSGAINFYTPHRQMSPANCLRRTKEHAGCHKIVCLSGVGASPSACADHSRRRVSAPGMVRRRRGPKSVKKSTATLRVAKRAPEFQPHDAGASVLTKNNQPTHLPTAPKRAKSPRAYRYPAHSPDAAPRWFCRLDRT